MSVYEYLKVGPKKIYSDEEILRQFLEMGCIEFPKDHDDYGYIKQHGIIKSAEFINMAGGITRIPFCLPRLRKSKTQKYYDISSCNYKPIPFVAFEWVRRYFPKNTYILYEIETRKLFKGKIGNYFKKAKWTKKLFEEERRKIEMRKRLHKLDEN